MTASANLWTHTNTEAVDARPLDADASADLVIIGGGFTGCAAALEAARSGASVVLLEAQSVAHGGSGRNVGLVNAGLWLPPEEVVAIMGEAAGPLLIEALGRGPETVFALIRDHGIACEAVQNGTLHLAHAPSGFRDLEERYRQGNRFGAPLQLLDRAETARRTGSERFHGALLDPRAGTVQPRAYCTGLARAAAGLGAAIHEQSPVTRVARSNGAWQVEANGHRVRARRLLVATNAYHAGAEGAYRPQYVAVSYCQFATAPLTAAQRAMVLPGGEGCWDTALVMSSIRTDAAGRLIVGGMGNSEGAAGAIHAGWARRKLKALYPALADLPFEHHWRGRIAMTRDHIPKVVEFAPEAYAVFGYSGRGICPGTVLGTAAARALLGAGAEALPLPVLPAYAERFTTLLGGYYEFGAALSHAAAPRLPV
ncbi:FAD-binding oxidoreductase [Pseudooceanicola sp. CBS1P-1]|uniref:FAD-dependent oxidoreductase n=1 Tax=Pseudooceanicola albus TaxID=2692189 RepID=A0A6L7G750_9RHOB|nr:MULTISPECIES: FAD-binding oxidoreductase [Pseudooceanicola]MBT9384361.1 FAD-binding oxidoreductase [Pseudooceanicola endophyticus]MXN19901.1 FAD-dependent oxidoreductase [Pseudooceanicola albus]